MRKKSVFLIIILMFLPFTIFAEYIDDENIASDVTSAEADSGEVLDFTLGVEISLGVNILGFIPGAFSILGIPLSLSSESVSFVPQGGFFYCSNLWSDLHNSFYIPAGLTVLYNPFKLGCNFMYYFPVGGDNDNQMISASIVTDILYLKLGKFSLFSEISLGPIWVLDPDGTRVQLLISFSVIPCYMFEFAVD